MDLLAVEVTFAKMANLIAEGNIYCLSLRRNQDGKLHSFINKDTASCTLGNGIWSCVCAYHIHKHRIYYCICQNQASSKAYALLPHKPLHRRFYGWSFISPTLYLVHD